MQAPIARNDAAARHPHIPSMPRSAHPALPAPERLLALPAGRTARLLCRAIAARADAAASLLDAGGEQAVDARHDLRVALRELRVTLEAYADALDDTVPKKLARRARALSRRLGEVRDRDVQEVLLHSVSEGCSAPQRTALRRMTRLGAHDDGAPPPDAAAFLHEWRRIADVLSDTLASWNEPQRLDGPDVATPFGLLAAAALDRATRKLARRCAKVTAPGDVAEMHAARLSIKSARYILKPLVGEDDSARAMLRSLRTAQDLLGGMLDAHALRAALRQQHAAIASDDSRTSRTLRQAIESGDRDLTHRIASAFDQLIAWRTAAALATQVTRLHAIAASWRDRVTTPMEYERKWLLSALPPRVRELTADTLRQGYLPGDTLVERIRSITRAGKTRWIRTVKLGRGVARIEVEEDATPALGKALFALTRGRRVEKKRYSVSDGARTWEIDDFTDRTLVLAEVEFPDANAEVEFPAWLAPYVVREVTDDAAFTNWKLAR